MDRARLCRDRAGLGGRGTSVGAPTWRRWPPTRRASGPPPSPASTCCAPRTSGSTRAPARSPPPPATASPWRCSTPASTWRARWRPRSGAVPADWFDAYGTYATPADAAGPCSGHGTAVAGVIAGTTDDAGLAYGAAPGARLIAARIFDGTCRASASAVHAALQWVLDPDGDPDTADAPAVVNASWGAVAAGCPTTFQPDLAALRAAGIVVVAAAGNDTVPASPATLPERARSRRARRRRQQRATRVRPRRVPVRRPAAPRRDRSRHRHPDRRPRRALADGQRHVASRRRTSPACWRSCCRATRE